MKKKMILKITTAMLALGVFSLTQNALSSNSSFAMESKENTTEKQPQQTEKKANDSKEVENSTDNLTDLEKQRVNYLKKQLGYIDENGKLEPSYITKTFKLSKNYIDDDSSKDFVKDNETKIKTVKVQDDINKAPIDVFAFETKKLGYDEPFVSDVAMPYDQKAAATEKDYNSKNNVNGGKALNENLYNTIAYTNSKNSLENSKNLNTKEAIEKIDEEILKLEKELEHFESAKKDETLTDTNYKNYQFGGVLEKQAYIDIQKRRIEDEIKIKNKEKEILKLKKFDELAAAKALKILELEKDEKTKQLFNDEFKKMFEPYEKDVKKLLHPDTQKKEIRKYKKNNYKTLTTNDIERIKNDFDDVTKYYENMKEDEAKYEEQIKLLKDQDLLRSRIKNSFIDETNHANLEIQDLTKKIEKVKKNPDYYFNNNPYTDEMINKCIEQINLKIKKQENIVKKLLPIKKEKALLEFDRQVLVDVIDDIKFRNSAELYKNRLAEIDEKIKKINETENETVSENEKYSKKIDELEKTIEKLGKEEKERREREYEEEEDIFAQKEESDSDNDRD